MALKPQTLNPGLAGRPARAAYYTQEIKNSQGETIAVGCPTATRALLA